MAEKKNNKPAASSTGDAKSTSAPPKKKAGGIFKILTIGIIVIMLGSIGFAAGVYLKLIDVHKIVDQYKLYEYPLVGKYFPKQQTNFEPVELAQPVESAGGAVQNEAPRTVQPLQQTPEPPKPPPDSIEQEKQIKVKQQEEAKRLSKMARLYGEMKADEAVGVLNQLDDETALAILGKMEDDQVAKILVVMDAKKAARFTQMMLKGKQQ